MRRTPAAVGILVLLCGISGCSTSHDDHPAPVAAAVVEIWSPLDGFEKAGRFLFAAHPSRIAASITGFTATADTWYANDDRTLTAFDAASGAQRWSTPLIAPPGPLADHTPAIAAADGALYVTWQAGTDTGEHDHVDILDPASGSTLRSTDLAPGEHVDSLAGRVLIVDSLRNDVASVVGYDYDTGRVAWTLPGGTRTEQAGGRRYVVMSSDPTHRETARIDPATGAVLWRADVALPARSGEQRLHAAAFGAESVYVAGETTYLTSDNRVFAYDSRTGRPLWDDRIDALSSIHDIFPLDGNRIGIYGNDSSGPLAIAVFDTAARSIVDIEAGKSATGAHQVVRLNGVTYGIMLPDLGPAEVVGSSGLVTLGKQNIPWGADLVGDHLVANAGGGELDSYAIPSLAPDKSVDIGTGAIAASTNDALIVTSNGSATVYR